MGGPVHLQYRSVGKDRFKAYSLRVQSLKDLIPSTQADEKVPPLTSKKHSFALGSTQRRMEAQCTVRSIG